MKHSRTAGRWAAASLALAIAAIGAPASAAPFTSGNLVAYRVAAGSNALAVFLDELRPDGTLVQSIALDDPTFRFSASSTGSEGLLNRSADGLCLVVPGYAAAPGAADPKSSVPRSVVFVDAAGAVARGTSLGSAFDTDAFRGAVSDDCNQVWASGAGSGSTRGIWYAAKNASSGTQLNNSNTQGITIAGGQLYASFAGGGTVNTIGSGLPTAGTPTATPLPGLAGRNHRGIVFLDLDGTPGVDTLYLAVNNDNVVRKYALVSGTWVDRGSVALAGAHGLVAADTGDGQVMLLATPEKGKVYRVFDRSGFNGTLSGTAEEVATATTGYAFYGLAWAPEASPPAAAPAAPAGLSATANGNSVQLAWPASGSAAYYVLEVSTDNFATVAQSTVASGSSATLNGLAVGSYTARVRAVNSKGGSSSTVSASFAAVAPPTTSLPATPAAYSGVVADPLDVLATTGLAFTVSDPVAAPGTVQVTASSGNTAVLPDSGLAVTRNGGDVLLKITPTGVGYADITVTVTNPQNASITRTIRYAASAHTAPTAGNGTRWLAGRSDGSTAIPLDGGSTLLIADDEAPSADGSGDALPGGNAFSLYTAGNGGGLPLKPFALDGTALGLASGSACATPGFTGLAACSADAEVDMESSFAVGSRIYAAGSHSNNRNGRSRPDRWRFFALDVSGSGSGTTLATAGYYQWLREDLRSWDQGNSHQLGANYLGLVASSDGGDGNVLKAPETDTLSGFSIEGMSTSPDGSQAWLGFRAPLVAAPGQPAVTADSATGRTHALIVPVTNFTALVAPSGGSQGTAQFGAPIRLDLGGRGIREIRKNAANQYLIIAGPPNTATGTAPRDFRLYSWDGSFDGSGAATHLRLRSTSLAAFTPPNLACAPEGIATLPADLDAGGHVRLVSDCGDADFYNDGEAAKDLPFAAWKKFRTDQLALAALPVLQPQSISFPQPADRMLGSGAFTPAATGGASGQPVQFEALTTGVCVAGGAQNATVTLLSAGLCTLRATQAGNGSYDPAVPVVHSFTVSIPTAAGTTLNGSSGRSSTVAGNTWQFASSSAGFGTIASLPADAALPAGYSFPFGVLGFGLIQGTPGSSATLSIALPQPAPAGAVLWKYGRTAATPSAHWYQFPATFSADRLTVSFSITDGGVGDDDLQANGVIVDPVALGVPLAASNVASIPTLGEWARALLALALAGLGALQLRRQRSRTA